MVDDELRRRLRNAAGPPATIDVDAIRNRAAQRCRLRRIRLTMLTVATTAILGSAALLAVAAVRDPGTGRIDASGTSPAATGAELLAAVRDDDLGLAAELLAAGADPDATGDLGATPLTIAAARSRPDLARLLIEAGADPSMPMSTGQAALHIAASTGDVALIEVLVEARPDLVDQPVADSTGSTALMLAAGSAHRDAVATLLAAGADPNATNRNGFTSLHFAIEDGADPDSVRLLLEGGGDPDLVTRPGMRTPRQAAAESPVPEIRDLLRAGS